MCRAIISSSLVGMTHTETRLPAREIWVSPVSYTHLTLPTIYSV